jgi:hypothetical protein
MGSPLATPKYAVRENLLLSTWASYGLEVIIASTPTPSIIAGTGDWSGRVSGRSSRRPTPSSSTGWKGFLAALGEVFARID